jgi:hypothetical protein
VMIRSVRRSRDGANGDRIYCSACAIRGERRE